MTLLPTLTMQDEGYKDYQITMYVVRRLPNGPFYSIDIREATQVAVANGLMVERIIPEQ